MNLEELEIFIDVAQKSSFALVAKERNLAPSSVSRAISSLEDKLGIRLFQRTTRKVSITEAGQSYLNTILPLVEDLKAAAENAYDVQVKPKGVIRLTSSVTFGNQALMPLIQDFMERYPDIELEYVLTDQVIDLVAERIDIAIRHGKLKDSSFIASKLFSTCYRIVASPSYIKEYGRPSLPQDLEQHQCLIFDWPLFRQKWKFKHQDGTFEEVPVIGRYRMTNGTALRGLALRGAGVSLLVNWLVDDAIARGDLIDLFPDYQVSAHNFDTAVWLMTPSRSYMPLRVRLLTDFLKEGLKQ